MIMKRKWTVATESVHEHEHHTIDHQEQHQKKTTVPLQYIINPNTMKVQNTLIRDGAHTRIIGGIQNHTSGVVSRYCTDRTIITHQTFRTHKGNHHADNNKWHITENITIPNKGTGNATYNRPTIHKIIQLTAVSRNRHTHERKEPIPK